MELFLIQFAAFLRPLASLDVAEAAFEVAGIALFGLVVLAVLISGASRKVLKLSAVDFAIAAFTVWCLTAYIVYYDVSRIRDVAKLLIPLLTYVAVKNVISNDSQYVSVLRWALFGFAAPILLSTVLIMTGQGYDYVSYWTNIVRWRGAYQGAHSLGHSMTLFLMLLMIYAFFCKRLVTQGVTKSYVVENAFWLITSLAAIYCLYMSQVRSAVVGLLVFGAISLFFLNRRLLIGGVIALTAAGVLLLPYWLPALLPEFAMVKQGIEVDRLDMGSGRPRMWLNDLNVFAGAPIDQKLAGVGIGNKGEFSAQERLYGHNDWLELLTQTGIVGLLLFLWIQVSLFRVIRHLHGPERYLFLGLFCAVNIMMIVSNSYAWRIQVSQLYYMALAYIEVHYATAVLRRGEEWTEQGALAK